MILTNEELTQAQDAVLNLQKVLQEARQVHSAREYRAMSEPILLEIQRREQEILVYLSTSKVELSVD